MMRASIIVATGLGLALCAPAEAQDESMVSRLGVGTRTCAYWLTNATTENAGEHWIDGFWSGLNEAYPPHDVGHTVDGVDIRGEIKKRCMDHPSELLVYTTAWVYGMLRDEKR